MMFWVWGVAALILVTAGCEFRTTRYDLTVTLSGSGSVSPSGGTYDEGTRVTLSATPDSGWTFVGWSGDVSGSATPIQVVMDSDKAVKATFIRNSSENTYELSVLTNGSGSVSPSGGIYESGSSVTLTASPESGWEFSGWSGDVSGSDTVIQVVMDSDKTVVASFYTSTNEPDEFEPIANSSASGSYMDSPHFRIYGTNSSANLALEHLEAAYRCFVTDWGFRSTGLSVHDSENDGPYYKMNVLPKSMSAGGYMGYDSRQGVAYLEINSRYVSDPKITVHEYGHALTLHSIRWMDQGNTGAWWETVANWVADTYVNSSYYSDVSRTDGGTLIDLGVNISQSYLTIVNDQNYYQAWPLLTYLTNNPDNYPGLGRMTVPNLFQNHRRNNETPLHVLERISSVSVQKILGRYWARMAYLDIGHTKAKEVFFNVRGNLNYNNLDAYGNQTYRVKSGRRPMYGGSNIIPLRITGNGDITVSVENLGNGRSDSNFTATLAIRSNSGSVRYVDLPYGSGRATVESYEEASLVVVNTPDNLINYDAFSSTESSPECIGLNYEVDITGAAPRF